MEYEFVFALSFRMMWRMTCVFVDLSMLPNKMREQKNSYNKLHIGTALKRLFTWGFWNGTAKTTWNRKDKYEAFPSRFDSFAKALLPKSPLCLQICHSYARLDSETKYSLFFHRLLTVAGHIPVVVRSYCLLIIKYFVFFLFFYNWKLAIFLSHSMRARANPF